MKIIALVNRWRDTERKGGFADKLREKSWAALIAEGRKISFQKTEVGRWREQAINYQVELWVRFKDLRNKSKRINLKFKLRRGLNIFNAEELAVWKSNYFKLTSSLIIFNEMPHIKCLSPHNEMQQTFTNKLNLIQIHDSQQNHTKQWQRLPGVCANITKYMYWHADWIIS